MVVGAALEYEGLARGLHLGHDHHAGNPLHECFFRAPQSAQGRPARLHGRGAVRVGKGSVELVPLAVGPITARDPRDFVQVFSRREHGRFVGAQLPVVDGDLVDAAEQSAAPVRARADPKRLLGLDSAIGIVQFGYCADLAPVNVERDAASQARPVVGRGHMRPAIQFKSLAGADNDPVVHPANQLELQPPFLKC